MFESLPKKVLKELKAAFSQETPVLDAICEILKSFETVFPKYNRDQDEDMLLFQYGSYDWGKGEWFEFDILRQFYKNERIIQIHTTYYFSPDENLRNVEPRNEWLNSGLSPSKWKQDILESDGYRKIKDMAPDRIVVWMEDAE